jgi:hypothetical protein
MTEPASASPPPPAHHLPARPETPDLVTPLDRLAAFGVATAEAHIHAGIQLTKRNASITWSAMVRIWFSSVRGAVNVTSTSFEPLIFR